MSPQSSDNEGRNRDSSSQLDIDQSIQSGISTPRPDSGFVDKEEIEVIEIYMLCYKDFKNYSHDQVMFF